MHNGLPVTVIVSTTLQEISTGAAQVVTGGGTLLPMRDLIRMAGHAYHYLAVFDEHRSRPLYLARPRRIASADQRVILYAKDRGCTAAGCDVPGYWTDVHHTDHWSRGGLTDIEELTLACKADHRLADKAGGQSTSATTTPSGSRRPILTTASRRPTIITIQKGFSTATDGAGSCSLIRHCAFTVPKGPNTRELSACCDTHQQCLAH